MNIEVIASVSEARTEELVGKTVIVIDVLRATSTITTALANGSLGVTPVETVNQARGLQADGELLGGERSCRKIPGFDLGNSPWEYASEIVSGKRIIMTTTNGTLAIQKSQKASHILAGCMLNAASAAELAVDLRRDLVLLCAGTQGLFSLEDGLCAGKIIAEVEKRMKHPLEIGDFGKAMKDAFLYTEHRLEDTLLGCANGKRLSKLGFEADVHYCSRTDILEMVPVLSGSTMLPSGVLKK